MAQGEIIQLHLLDTDIQVRAEKDQDRIRQIEKFVQEELGKIKSKNQFANHIHIALLGCLNIAENLFDLTKQLEDDTRNHEDELIYYKNIENTKNKEQEELNLIIEEKNDEINRLKSDHENKVNDINTKNSEAINELNKKHEEELNTLQKEKDNIIASINKEKDEKIAEITSTSESKYNKLLSDKNNEITNLKNSHQAEKEKISKEKDTIILNLKQDKENEIAQITQEKDAIITRLRKERESELRTLHQEKDLKIEQLTSDNDTLTNINVSMTKDLDNKNELLNQYREKLKQSKEENDINRKSILDLQNQLFENQIELAKLQKQIEGGDSSNRNYNHSYEDRSLNDVIYELKNQKDELNSEETE